MGQTKGGLEGVVVDGGVGGQVDAVVADCDVGGHDVGGEVHGSIAQTE